ncbi:MAG: transporter substrate-binding domain-containing protein [Deltaproteobacteria bacterium]|nr:transporter substrate-binding domain-containing protein [Deltaproteobacteria bacterium]
MVLGNTAFLKVLFLIAACAVAFPGCLGGDPDSLERVRKAGEISFAMGAGFPPFSFYNDKNELVGFDVDVSLEVAKRLGVKLKPVTVKWSGIIDGLLAEQYDGILGSMAITEEREKLVDFSLPYYYSKSRLVVRNDASYQSLADVEGKIIGVVEGTTYVEDARTLKAGEVRLFGDEQQSLLALQVGEVDGVITDMVVAGNPRVRDLYQVRPVGPALHSEAIAVAFRKQDGSLRKKVNDILKDMMDDGALDELIKKVATGAYNVPPTGTPS